MAKIRFLHQNRWNPSTITIVASSAVSALPAAATQNPDRSYVWRSATATTEQTLDIDLGAGYAGLPVASVAIANPRILGVGVIKLQQLGDGAAAGAAVDVATLSTANTRTRTAFAFFASQTHRHWRLVWTNPTAASDYAEAGYIHLGPVDEAAINVQVPMAIRRVDPSVVSTSIDGQKTRATRTKYYAGEARFSWVEESQLETLQAMFDTIGIQTPIFMVLDEALAWTTWYAEIVSPLDVQFEEATGRYSPRFAWEEAR